MSEPNLIEGKCDNCDGEGQTNEYEAGWCECALCDGLGIITTELGNQVQAIIWRKLRAIRREEAREEERSHEE